MSDKRDGGDDGTWRDPELAAATRNKRRISLLEAATLPPKEFTAPTLPITAPSETPLSMSMFATQADYWKARAEQAEAECEIKDAAWKKHVEQLATGIREANERADAAEAECERLREQVYVPGIWKCAKCKLELMASVLAASSGSIHADNRPQECPNNCGPMWRITERDRRKETQTLHEKEFMRAQAAESREREAYERAAQVLRAKANTTLIREGCKIYREAAAIVSALSDERREG